jgi:hypothetical protein
MENDENEEQTYVDPNLNTTAADKPDEERIELLADSTYEVSATLGGPVRENLEAQHAALQRELGEDPSGAALRRRLGKSAALAMDEELRALRAKVAAYESAPSAGDGRAAEMWRHLLRLSPLARCEQIEAQLTAIDAGHQVAAERDVLVESLREAQHTIANLETHKRSLEWQVRVRDEASRALQLDNMQLRGQISAYQHVLKLQADAAVQIQALASASRTLLPEPERVPEDLPDHRQPEALQDVKDKVASDLKAAGIDTASICGYQWEGETTDACDGGVHECRLVNPLHVGDHACDPRWCGMTLSQETAERIEAAKGGASVE